MSTCLDTARRRLLQCMDYREKPKKGRKTLTVMFVTSYVDDALRSFPTETEAVDVLKRAQSLLACYNIKFHKIVSNKAYVMNAFPTEDQVKNIKQLDLNPVADSLPVQRSLGVIWNMTTNAFMFNIHSKRGTLHH